jgi:hypothetical protein
MQKNIHLRIDEPCHERWDRMQPGPEGRFCGSCWKTVVDFTLMSDREVFEWFAKARSQGDARFQGDGRLQGDGRSQSQGNVCGRLHADQLNRALTSRPETRRKNGWLWWWNYLLAGLLMSSEVSAQTGPPAPVVTKQDTSTRKRPTLVGAISPLQLHRTTQRSLPDTLRGRVMEADGHVPVPFATITIDHGRGVMADADGYFVIPSSQLTGKQMLTISAIGFESKPIDTKKTWGDKNEQTIALGLNLTTMGEVDVVAGKVVCKKSGIEDTLARLKDTVAKAELAKKTLTVYPNPVARGAGLMLSLRLDQPGTWSAQLYAMSGELIQTMTIEGDEKSKTVEMNIPATLKAGTYAIRLSHPSIKKAYTQMVVVL